MYTPLCLFIYFSLPSIVLISCDHFAPCWSFIVIAVDASSVLPFKIILFTGMKMSQYLYQDCVYFIDILLKYHVVQEMIKR